MGTTKFIIIVIFGASILLPIINGCDHRIDLNDTGNQSSNTGDSLYSISGIIKDSVTNSQIDSVFLSIPGDTVFLTRGGIFELRNKEPGVYKIYFSKQNYLTKFCQIELNTDTLLTVQMVDSGSFYIVDYYPLNIGATWKYHRLNGDILITEEGIEDWTVIDTNKLENGNIEYLIRTVFNGKSVEYGTTDTIDIINDIHDISITETPNHLISTPHFNSQFDRYYTESEPDTVKLFYNDGQNKLIYKIYLKKNVGMVYSYYQFFPSNIRSMYPYRIYTLIY